MVLREISRSLSIVLVVGWCGPSMVVVGGRGCCGDLDRPPDSAVLVIREGYVRLDGWCSRAHVSSRMVSRASELVNLLLIQ